MSASTVHWTADTAIAALVIIARSPHVTDRERADARNAILTIVGAVDGYFDRHGREMICVREARRRGVIE